QTVDQYGGTLTLTWNANRSIVLVGIPTWGSPPVVQPFHGYVAEVMVWKRALSESELQQVGRYLTQKWGLNNAYYPRGTAIILR
ncbi:MAG: hypothetical protein PHR35_04225, partial [Kiritimatiellae bacterium]|nr:hypothetical protein [Kiritimatiellia bacterium]